MQESFSLNRHRNKNKTNVIPFPKQKLVNDEIADIDSEIIMSIASQEDIASWAGQILDIMELTIGIDLAGPRCDELVFDLQRVIGSHLGITIR